MTDNHTSTQQTAATLQSYLDTLVSGDLDHINEHFATDASWQIHGTLPLAGSYNGVDSIMNFLATAMGVLFVPGTQQFTFGTIMADDDTAALEWRVTGIGSATNLRCDNDYCGIFIVRERKNLLRPRVLRHRPRPQRSVWSPSTGRPNSA